ncbi:MAG: lipocalin family protein [Bacteroidetes bacterium]|nr:lipocalin family protein [Bacteroidota bacterium]MCB0854270.1 lipocalin family protein [Bacteroidota bacterium]
MKTIKILFSLTVVALMLAATGCSPYPEGPDFSLASKEARIAGTWVVNVATDSAGQDVTSEYEDWRYTFSEDGTALLSRSEFAAGSTKITLEYEGTWTLSEDGTIFKVDMSAEVIKDVFVEEKADFLIRRLTQKEFWLTSQDEDLEKYELVPF